MRKPTKRNKQWAKNLTVKVWKWLEENPLRFKWYLPEQILRRIEGLKDECPLCELYQDFNNKCKGCPLAKSNYCMNDTSAFRKYVNATFDLKTIGGVENRKRKNAGIIRKTVEEWEI